MIKKIKILAFSLLSISAIGALYLTVQLTKLRDLDILDISTDEEEEWF